jgi:hypothetical protein
MSVRNNIIDASRDLIISVGHNIFFFWCDLNIIIRIEYILLKLHWGMKALIELHFQHEALPHFIENVPQSTPPHPNEASKECIQFFFFFLLFIFQ